MVTVVGIVLAVMKMPRPDGLSSSEESTALFNFEDALKTALCSGDPAAVFVGRMTSAGEREFFFYASSLNTRALGLGPAFELDKVLTNMMELHP